MKALDELLPMGMKGAKSGLPFDSPYLPDSATCGPQGAGPEARGSVETVPKDVSSLSADLLNEAVVFW